MSDGMKPPRRDRLTTKKVTGKKNKTRIESCDMFGCGKPSADRGGKRPSKVPSKGKPGQYNDERPIIEHERYQVAVKREKPIVKNKEERDIVKDEAYTVYREKDKLVDKKKWDEAVAQAEKKNREAKREVTTVKVEPKEKTVVNKQYDEWSKRENPEKKPVHYVETKLTKRDKNQSKEDAEVVHKTTFHPSSGQEGDHAKLYYTKKGKDYVVDITKEGKLRRKGMSANRARRKSRTRI